MRKLQRVLAILGMASTAAVAQGFGDGEGTAIRPVDIYIYSASQGINQRIETRLTAPAVKTMSLSDYFGKLLCHGEVNATTKNWVFNNLRCPTLKIEIPTIELIENFRWGVMRHSLAKTELPNGLTVGIFLHLGSETQWESETRISPEKIQSLYGAFPDWKVPTK